MVQVHVVCHSIQQILKIKVGKLRLLCRNQKDSISVASCQLEINHHSAVSVTFFLSFFEPEFWGFCQQLQCPWFSGLVWPSSGRVKQLEIRERNHKPKINQDQSISIRYFWFEDFWNSEALRIDISWSSTRQGTAVLHQFASNLSESFLWTHAIVLLVVLLIQGPNPKVKEPGLDILREEKPMQNTTCNVSLCRKKHIEPVKFHEQKSVHSETKYLEVRLSYRNPIGSKVKKKKKKNISDIESPRLGVLVHLVSNHIARHLWCRICGNKYTCSINLVLYKIDPCMMYDDISWHVTSYYIWWQSIVLFEDAWRWQVMLHHVSPSFCLEVFELFQKNFLGKTCMRQFVPNPNTHTPENGFKITVWI